MNKFVTFGFGSAVIAIVTRSWSSARNSMRSAQGRAVGSGFSQRRTHEATDHRTDSSAAVGRLDGPIGTECTELEARLLPRGDRGHSR